MAQDTRTQNHTALAASTQDEANLGARHPLAHILGSYKDDPTLDAVMDEVYKNRCRLEAEADDAEKDLAA